MEFGVAISTSREGLFYPIGFATPSSLVKMAKVAEELGFECVWGNDHLTTQSYIKKRGDHPNFFEPMITFSYLSAVTSKVKFGTGVVVGPTRNPVILAKTGNNARPSWKRPIHTGSWARGLQRRIRGLRRCGQSWRYARRNGRKSHPALKRE